MTLLSLLMRERKLPDTQLARRIGVSTSTVARWRNGEFRPIGAHAEKLETIFHVSAAQLCADVIIRTQKEFKS
jgi:transcriptional regulator with XRE-family HTH domain